VDQTPGGEQDRPILGEAQLAAGLGSLHPGRKVFDVDAAGNHRNLLPGNAIGLVEDLTKGLAQDNEAIAALVYVGFELLLQEGTGAPCALLAAFIGPGAMEAEGDGNVLGQQIHQGEAVEGEVKINRIHLGQILLGKALSSMPEAGGHGLAGAGEIQDLAGGAEVLIGGADPQNLKLVMALGQGLGKFIEVAIQTTGGNGKPPHANAEQTRRFFHGVLNGTIVIFLVTRFSQRS
jgi:hypothetical protein